MSPTAFATLRRLALAGILALAAPPIAAAEREVGAPNAAQAAPSAIAPADRLDPDPAAMHVPLPITFPAGAAVRERLRLVERGLQRYPDHPVLLRERGYLRYRRGEVDAGEADYARAVQIAGADLMMRRHVLWSQGWARFNAGNDAGALDAWRTAAALHGGEPFWWPYTAALPAWRSGRRDEAVALFDRAVRGMPEWGTERGFTLRTRHWPEPQFEVARDVFGAWQASRP